MFVSSATACVWLHGLLAVLLASGPALPHAAHAASRIRIETKETQTSNGKTAAALLVNGEVVASIAKDSAGNPPLRVVSIAANQLSAAYRSSEFELKAQSTDDSGRRWVLFLNGRALLVANDAEAKAWGVEPKELALSWQRKLNEALASSPPPGSGKPAQPPAPPKPAPSKPPALSSGKSLPAGSGRVPEPPSSTSLASFPELPAGAIVTGSRPGSEVINAALEAALRFERRIPGAAPLLWKLAGKNAQPLSLAPGQSAEAQLEYSSLGVGGTAALGVYNRSLSLPRESLTLFSNSPESVYSPQLLYEAQLPGGTAARLVYHHQCNDKAGLRCVVRVLSPDQPGALHVVPGTARADINTFFVGFSSAERFWQNINSGNGYAAPLDAGGQVVLLSQELAYGYTASGYMKLTNLGPQPLRIEVLALPAGARLPEGAAARSSSTSHCVFDSPYFTQEAAYSAGDPWLYLRLGSGRPESSTDDTVLHGCYGMTHNYNVELRNPGTAPALLFVVLRASAGEVKGQFYLNDEYVYTPLVASGEELLLREIPLPPGASQQLRLKAIALNGGFYPASVIIRETRFP